MRQLLFLLVLCPLLSFAGGMGTSSNNELLSIYLVLIFGLLGILVINRIIRKIIKWRQQEHELGQAQAREFEQEKEAERD